MAVLPRPGRFSDADLDGLPVAAQSLLRAAIEPGTPRYSAIRLRMRGSIKLKRWLPFRATQVIAPGVGFIWRARVAGLVTGYDQHVDGRGAMQWKMARLFTVADFAGPDITRSSAGREAAESVWLPTAMMPECGVEWSAADDRRPTGRIPTMSGATDVSYEIDIDGKIRSVALPRWGDPKGTGEFGLHTFGGEMSHHETVGGITIPTRGAVGWHFGEPGWDDGEFFRFRLTAIDPVH